MLFPVNRAAITTAHKSHDERERTMTQGTNITMNRRSFLTSALAASALAGAGSLMGCAPQPKAVGSEGLSETGTAAAGVDGYCSTVDWLGQAPQIADDEIVATVDTEILVLGGGHAGIQCAHRRSRGPYDGSGGVAR